MTVKIEDFNRRANEEGTFDLLVTDENVKQEDIIKELRAVYDPEISINIFDLGLIWFVAKALFRDENALLQNPPGIPGM